MSIPSLKRYLSNLTLASGDFVADKLIKQKQLSNSRLLENMEYGIEALNYTLKSLSLGSSNQPHSIVSDDFIDHMRKEALDQSQNNSSIDRQDDFFYKLKKSATKHKVGNCIEHALVALYYLKENKRMSDVDLVVMTNADHGFTVIDRTPNSSPTDHSSWGESAVICDPWARVTYPASELIPNLKEICKIYHIALDDDRPLVRIDDFNSSLIKYENEKRLKPTLSKEDKLDLERKLKKHLTLKHRISTLQATEDRVNSNNLDTSSSFSKDHKMAYRKELRELWIKRMSTTPSKKRFI